MAGLTLTVSVELIMHCWGEGNGRCGTGMVKKAASFAHKIAGDLSSTGSPALFRCTRRPVHCDVGVLGCRTW